MKCQYRDECLIDLGDLLTPRSTWWPCGREVTGTLYLCPVRAQRMAQEARLVAARYTGRLIGTARVFHNPYTCGEVH